MAGGLIASGCRSHPFGCLEVEGGGRRGSGGELVGLEARLGTGTGTCLPARAGVWRRGLIRDEWNRCDGERGVRISPGLRGLLFRDSACGVARRRRGRGGGPRPSATRATYSLRSRRGRFPMTVSVSVELQRRTGLVVVG
jgi:hypothetical protein